MHEVSWWIHVHSHSMSEILNNGSYPSDTRLIFRFCFYAHSPGGGGGGALTPHIARYVPRHLKNGRLRSELERENVGLWSGLEREMGVSGADL